MDKDHPKVKFGKTGILIINLGTPDSTSWWDIRRYLKEFKLNESVYPSFVLHKVNKKLMHFVGILKNKENQIAAIFETILGHIDLKKRKIVNFPDDRFQHILNVCNEQNKNIELPFDVKLYIKDINA